jgi:putative peptidoglycan lipid II flippase
MKLSKLTRAAFLLVIFFALDKGLGLIRQVVIARQFGLSNELDAFNVANNLPDLLFALISGGALSIAFIPILTEVLTRQGRPQAWHLFSNIANLAFLVTAVLAVVIALLADPLVRWEVGIAPGFTAQQQHLVAQLMRLNLIATLIFSISGLVMAGLQANQHFLLPALAPVMYNLGQIFGALILAPTVGYTIAGVTLPAFGLGVHGLVYGVIGGAALHLLIQIPGLVKFRFIWNPGLGLKTDEVRKVLRLMGPRLITMLFIQMDFLVRDNLASRLAEGSVSALTYGWMLMQVPETIIGTAIATAMLPTLSELFSKGENQQFKETVERAIRVLLAVTLPVAVIFGAGLRPLLSLVFGFDPAGTDLLLWTTRGYLVGLTGQCLLEVAIRSFYSRQNALTPLLAAGMNLMIYVGFGLLLFRVLGAPGISLTDALAFTAQAILLLLLLNRHLPTRLNLSSMPFRVIGATLLGGGVTLGVLWLGGERAVIAILAMLAGVAAALPLIWREVRLLMRL